MTRPFRTSSAVLVSCLLGALYGSCQETEFLVHETRCDVPSTRRRAPVWSPRVLFDDEMSFDPDDPHSVAHHMAAFSCSRVLGRAARPASLTMLRSEHDEVGGEGLIDGEGVERALTAAEGAIRECVLRDPSIRKGRAFRVEMHIRIDGRGRAETLAVNSLSLLSPSAQDRCFRQPLARQSFPAANGGTLDADVSFTFCPPNWDGPAPVEAPWD